MSPERSGLDRSVGAPPAVTGATRPRFKDITIRIRDRIMPNHVRAVAQVFPGATGSFWQKEYYDHLIRDEAQFHRAVKYVMENPEKANLPDWPWVWMRGQDARVTAGEDAGATVGEAIYSSTGCAFSS